MRLWLLLFPLALLAVCQNAASESIDSFDSSRNEIAAIQSGINAIASVGEYFDPDKMKEWQLNELLGMFSKALSFIGTLIKLFNKQPSQAQQLAREFAEVNAKLIGISIKLNIVVQTIEWNTAKTMYSNYERKLKLASQRYDAYLKTSPAEKDRAKRLFLRAFKAEADAASYLFNGVMDREVTLGKNLAQAVVDKTSNHRKQVMSFLAAISQLILRGAQMEIAYEAMEHSSASAESTRKDWNAKMRRLASEMKSVENKVKSTDVWYPQMKRDAAEFINAKRSLNNQKFSEELFKFLTDKFDWLHWFVVAYKAVSGTNNHNFAYSYGAHFFRVAGNRNVIIGSATQDRRWSKDESFKSLVMANYQHRQNSDAKKFFQVAMAEQSSKKRYSRLVVTICSNCDASWKASDGRLAYKRMVCSPASTALRARCKRGKTLRGHGFIFG